MRKVAILFGGKSCENEISILTGVFALNVLGGEKYTLVPVYIHTDGEMYSSPKMKDLNVFKERKVSSFTKVFFDGGWLYAWGAGKKKVKRLYKIDVALNCCHGGLGEGGGVSAMMAWNNVPLASPDLTASGVFMDKSLTKTVMKGLKIPTVDSIRVNERDYQKRGAFLLRSIEARLKYPVVIKPAHLGSSIGIAVANNETEAKRGIENAFLLDERVVIEKYLAGKKDVNCAAYSRGGEIFVSEAEEAFGAGIYSFEDKYVKRSSDGVRKDGKSGLLRGQLQAGQSGEENAPKRTVLSGNLREKIRAYTRTIYKRMDLKGVVRMDYLVNGEQVYLCEVNTVPGSLAYYLFCERISDAKTFFADLIEEALSRASEQEKKIITTGILKGTKED